MAKVEIEIVTKGGETLEQVAQKTGSLKTQIRQLKLEMESMDESSDSYADAARKIGEMQDKLNDASEAARANAGPAFETLGNHSAALGDKLRNLDFDGAANSLKAMGKSAGSIKFSDLTSGIKSFGSALASVGKALLANPIFLIAAAVAGIAVALYNNFDKIQREIPGVANAVMAVKEAWTGVSVELQKQGVLVAERKAKADEEYKTATSMDETLKARGLSETQILNIKKEAVQEQINALKADIEYQKSIQASSIAVAERNEKIVDGILQVITIPIQALLGSIDAIFAGIDWAMQKIDSEWKPIGLNLRESFNSLVSTTINPFDAKAVAEEGNASIKAAEQQLVELQNTQDGFKNRQKAINQAAADKAAADAKAKADQALKDEIARRSQLDADKAARRAAAGIEDDAEIKAFERKTAELERIAVDSDGRITGLKISNVKKVKSEEEKAAETKKTQEEKMAEFLLRQNARRLRDVTNVIEGLRALSELALGDTERNSKKAFKVTKALNMAQTAMNTYAAIMSVMKDPSYVGPSRWIAAASAGALGLAQLAKISKSKYESSGDSGGGSSSGSVSAPSTGSGSTPTTPTFAAFDTSFLNNDQRPEQNVTRAYVISGDVSTQAAADARIKEKAKL